MGALLALGLDHIGKDGRFFLLKEHDVLGENLAIMFHRGVKGVTDFVECRFPFASDALEIHIGVARAACAAVIAIHVRMQWRRVDEEEEQEKDEEAEKDVVLVVETGILARNTDADRDFR